ncbi:acyltransferase domain-containing protein [Actinoplanes sp. LDG1-01]|uniref:Acyltransferase domain-containing protein n=1 Tax=Paractinoplanes lichenicola TaxID=2802976 RepID=A0ABS1W0A7_9ACTN|nr:type I polyketide synthase [Actinoplanes lichenicola]MBL7260168.1 acyltransferase domain-containing protein [Actinoplanes lichenicola]
MTSSTEAAAEGTGAQAHPDLERQLLATVRTAVAATLGWDTAASVPADLAFQDAGFDSVAAVSLHARIVEATGLQLPVTLAFDYPSPRALARHLLAAVTGEAAERHPLRAASDVAGEPVAIVGMACRFPGGIASPEDLWRLVAEGGEVVSGFPTDRGWDLSTLHDPQGRRPGTSVTDRGGFLDEAGAFDADFFGISPREALAMDPQQRHLLEVAWEALERAGIAATALRGTRTAVLVGAEAQEYGPKLASAEDGLEGHLVTGTAGSVASGRIAYTLGLEGAALTIDSACSASLVALHLGAQALRLGEADLALAGGVAIMSGPGGFVSFSRQGGLARDGRCKAFSAHADGTAWSEGVGLLVLERLDDARRNGHQVLALLRGSAVNQDGASNGLTAPNGPAQQRVIRQALAGAGLGPEDVDAIEAHGTGTALGDPIEANALLATYGRDRTGEPAWLGSLKSNLGHTQAAAGVAGVIKMVMAMRAGVLPRTLHVDEPTPYVDWAAGGVALLRSARPWPDTGRPRRAAVSSFGFSGTNAHAVLEQAPDEQSAAVADEDPAPAGVLPVLLAASGPRELATRAARLCAELTGRPEITVLDAARTLARRRPRGNERAVILAGDTTDLLAGLTALAAGRTDHRVLRGRVSDAPVTLRFAEPVGEPGAGLGDTFPVYARAHAQASRHFAAHLDGPATHPVALTFAHQVAVAETLRRWGVTPGRVTGTGVGAIVADHVAGIFDLPDAVAEATARIWGLDEDELAWLGELITRRAPEVAVADPEPGTVDHPVAVATLNSPRDLIAVLAGLWADGVEPRWDVFYGGWGTELADFDAPVVAWPVSSRGQEALRAVAARLAAHPATGSAADIGYSLATTRSALPDRAVVVGRSVTALAAGLRSVAEGRTAPGVALGRAVPEPRLAVMFSGQGSQRAGMGRELHGAYPVFAHAFDAACAALDRHLDGPLAEVVLDPDSVLLDETGWTQPGLFAFEVALYRLVESWGVVPAVVMGHSIGEIAAAHVAGVLDLADAAALVAARARMMQALPAGGAMLAVQAGEPAVTERIAGVEDVGIAAVNGPSSVVISGAAEAVDALGERFRADGKLTTRLRVSHAFHSPLMEPMLDRFAAVAETLTYRPASIPVVSTLTGAITDVGSPGHWVEHVRSAVRFADGVAALAEQDVTAVLELGPDRVLTTLADGLLDDTVTVTVAAAGRRDHPEPETLVAALAELYTGGVPVDWASFHAGARRIELPTYPFQREHFWLRPSGGADVSAAGADPAGHPLLAAVVDLPDEGGLVATGVLSHDVADWVADHEIGGSVLLPAPAFVELALWAGGQLGCTRLRELTIDAPLIIPDHDPVAIRVVVGPGDAATEARMVTIHARPGAGDGHWTRHASGTLTAQNGAGEPLPGDWPPAGAEPIDLSGFYAGLSERGYDYGPRLQGLRAAWRHDGDVLVEADLPDPTDAHLWGLHPALLDAVLHAESLLPDTDTRELVAPSAWSQVALHATGATSLRARLHRVAPDTLAISAADPAGTPVLEVATLVSRPLNVPRPVPSRSTRRGLRDVLPRSARRADPDAGGLAARLAGKDRAEQEQRILAVVREIAAATLGHAESEPVGPSRSFRELGFDSLTAVEYRNRLTAVTGIGVPATAIFDHPTPARLADHLSVRLLGPATALPPGAKALADIDLLDSALARVEDDDEAAAEIGNRLQALVSRWSSRTTDTAAGDLAHASADDLLDIIQNEFGRT